MAQQLSPPSFSEAVDRSLGGLGNLVAMQDSARADRQNARQLEYDRALSDRQIANDSYKFAIDMQKEKNAAIDKSIQASVQIMRDERESEQRGYEMLELKRKADEETAAAITRDMYRSQINAAQYSTSPIESSLAYEELVRTGALTKLTRPERDELYNRNQNFAGQYLINVEGSMIPANQLSKWMNSEDTDKRQKGISAAMADGALTEDILLKSSFANDIVAARGMVDSVAPLDSEGAALFSAFTNASTVLGSFVELYGDPTTGTVDFQSLPEQAQQTYQAALSAKNQAIAGLKKRNLDPEKLAAGATAASELTGAGTLSIVTGVLSLGSGDGAVSAALAPSYEIYNQQKAKITTKYAKDEVELEHQLSLLQTRLPVNPDTWTEGATGITAALNRLTPLLDDPYSDPAASVDAWDEYVRAWQPINTVLTRSGAKGVNVAGTVPEGFASVVASLTPHTRVAAPDGATGRRPILLSLPSGTFVPPPGVAGTIDITRATAEWKKLKELEKKGTPLTPAQSSWVSYAEDTAHVVTGVGKDGEPEERLMTTDEVISGAPSGAVATTYDAIGDSMVKLLQNDDWYAQLGPKEWTEAILRGVEERRLYRVPSDEKVQRWYGIDDTVSLYGILADLMVAPAGSEARVQARMRLDDTVARNPRLQANSSRVKYSASRVLGTRTFSFLNPTVTTAAKLPNENKIAGEAGTLPRLAVLTGIAALADTGLAGVAGTDLVASMERLTFAAEAYTALQDAYKEDKGAFSRKTPPPISGYRSSLQSTQQVKLALDLWKQLKDPTSAASAAFTSTKSTVSLPELQTFLAQLVLSRGRGIYAPEPGALTSGELLWLNEMQSLLGPAAPATNVPVTK